MTGPDRAEGTATAPVANGHAWPCSGFDDGNHEPHRKGVWTCTCRAEGTAVLSDEERADIRKAFDRDVWAGEFNSLPTAIDRILAARAALPGTADTGAREAVEAALVDDAWVGHDEPITREDVARWAEIATAALAATPDGHQHAAEES